MKLFTKHDLVVFENQEQILKSFTK